MRIYLKIQLPEAYQAIFAAQILKTREEATMKFCKRYHECIQRLQDRLPGVSYVEFKKFKKILKHCTVESHKQSNTRFPLDEGNSSNEVHDINTEADGVGRLCRTFCPVCDRTFFPSLLNEMSAVLCCFNTGARQLLKLHIATGFQKYFVWLTSKWADDHLGMCKKGEDLVNYASINALAVRKILKKYDKIHYSKQGREFKTRAQSMQMEILQSPWLNELIAFRINSMNLSNGVTPVSDLPEDYLLTFDGEKPSLSCTVLDSVKLDIDLTCSICLETFFDPVSLKCCHIFCFSCACSAAAVTIVDGLECADPKSKCPLCRQERVFGDAVRLGELSVLLSKSCPEYWEQRLQTEKVERLRQIKEHWEKQCRAFMGF